jgi:hypothetical protein
MTLSLLGNLANGYAENGRLRWDIITLTVGSTIAIDAGGHASAKANDGSQITLTGSGTFRSSGQSQNVAGGGSWETRDSDGNVTGAGTYDVRKVVRFDVAPGTLPGPPLVTDNIGDTADARSGLLILSILYSDGSEGALTVVCELPVGTPASLFEGITASKGFVYFKEPMGGDTVFHVVPNGSVR